MTSAAQDRPELTPEQVKVLAEDIPEALAEETHDPWTGEPKPAATTAQVEDLLAEIQRLRAAIEAAMASVAGGTRSDAYAILAAALRETTNQALALYFKERHAKHP